MKSRRPVPITDKPFPLVPKLLATSFGAGFLPVAPGTWGALLAIILWLPLYFWSSQPCIFWVTLTAAVVYTVAGTWASSESEKYWGKDPVAACADETVGQWISLLPLSSCTEGTPWWMILLSLALFRFFDIAKPLGIRAMERLPRGYGMMADDILAGIYSVIILLIVNYIRLRYGQ
ncbi:MAG: phosphatidylglycerophosphatase A [Firmicutes bacterium]|nr:phosphatidylglycerophosphatase A [Bacillota bacterium]MCM1400554.1 phosphatidylglycerophosphatase A [Bacteroides sp.]MCM1476458.1 phosphatidylglycerophosphatase A [Bacteroides sp.]